jgi:hypothetical protein
MAMPSMTNHSQTAPVMTHGTMSRYPHQNETHPITVATNWITPSLVLPA